MVMFAHRVARCAAACSDVLFLRSSRPRLLHQPLWVRLGFGGLLLLLFGPALAQATSASILAAAEVRVGVERLAKLQYERTLPGEGSFALAELQKEKNRVVSALGVLGQDASLSSRRRGQISRLEEGTNSLLLLLDKTTQNLSEQDLNDCYRSSEALAAQLSFINTGLTNDFPDTEAATLVDLLTRAAAMVLRVGKANLAAQRGHVAAAVTVDARQTLVEFQSALAAISTQAQQEPQLKTELELVKNQWVLFSAALTSEGLVKNAQRLQDLRSTSDRIAQSLLVMARRVLVAREAGTRKAAGRV